MKLIYRLLSLVVLVSASASLFSCSDEPDNPVQKPEIPLTQVTASFSAETMDLKIGETNTRAVTTNCSNANVVYSSSDESVATVNASSGLVTAVAKGTATITATVAAPEGSTLYKGKATASYEVNVDYKVLGTAQIVFVANLSPDFLELITPVVSYRDNDGEHVVRLTKETCEYVRDEYTIDEETYVYEEYKWAPPIKCNIYQTIDFDETVSVTFESNKKEIEENREYDLSARTGVSGVSYSFSYNGKTYIGFYSSITIDITIDTGDGETHKNNIYSGESVSKYIENIVKDKKDFRVEISKDGKVKVNGE